MAKNGTWNGLPFNESKRLWREARRGNIEYHIIDRTPGWKCQTKGSDLTSDYLIDLFNKQDGKCFYTGRKLLMNPGKGIILPDSVSLDKLYPKNGYMQGNVVWCTYFANTAKGVLDIDEFLEFSRLVLNTVRPKDFL